MPDHASHASEVVHLLRAAVPDRRAMSLLLLLLFVTCHLAPRPWLVPLSAQTSDSASVGLGLLLLLLRLMGFLAPLQGQRTPCLALLHQLSARDRQRGLQNRFAPFRTAKSPLDGPSCALLLPPKQKRRGPWACIEGDDPLEARASCQFHLSES